MSKSPQLESGYTRIANEILEAIAKARFNPGEYKILLILFRKTYGWRGKKQDKISISQFSKLTGLSRSYCHKVINNLAIKGVLSKENSYICKYSFQKDYSKWKLFPYGENILKQMSSPKRTGVSSREDKTVHSREEHKRKKKLLQKKHSSRQKKMPTMLSSQKGLLGDMARKYKNKYNLEPNWDGGETINFYKIRKKYADISDKIMLQAWESYIWDDFTDFYDGHPLWKFCREITKFLEGKV